MPDRCWFAFRLRTLFAVVAALPVPLGWFAHSVNWIRQRHRIRETVGVLIYEHESLDPHRGVRPPSPLRIFGEKGAVEIDLCIGDKALADDVRRWYPEATIYRRVDDKMVGHEPLSRTWIGQP